MNRLTGPTSWSAAVVSGTDTQPISTLRHSKGAQFCVGRLGLKGRVRTVAFAGNTEMYAVVRLYLTPQVRLAWSPIDIFGAAVVADRYRFGVIPTTLCFDGECGSRPLGRTPFNPLEGLAVQQ